MLIDEFLPVYDFSERHETRVRASAAKTYKTIDATDFNESWVIWGLTTLRGLGFGRSSEKETLRELARDRFAVLGEMPPEEILLGLAGKFWTPTGSLQKIDAGNFKDFDKAGFAKAVWNFSVAKGGDDETILKTETRIRCLDEDSRQSFALYWTLVKPFSGVIREEMLRLIKEKAEGSKSEI